jgi:hypothetical protein
MLTHDACDIILETIAVPRQDQSLMIASLVNLKAREVQSPYQAEHRLKTMEDSRFKLPG